MAETTSARGELLTRLMVSAAALGVLVLKVVAPERVDATSVVLLVLVLIPWMSTILTSVDTAAGGFVLREVRRTQDGQQDDIDRMKFIFDRLIPRDELQHLQNLADDVPMPYDRGYTRPHLEAELRRLVGVELIARKAGKSFSSMGDEGDIREYFSITDAGRTYLRILQGFRP